MWLPMFRMMRTAVAEKVVRQTPGVRGDSVGDGDINIGGGDDGGNERRGMIGAVAASVLFAMVIELARSGHSFRVKA